MAIALHHNPHTRAGAVVWQLEEVGVPYTLRFVDLRGGAHKTPALLDRNPMGKLPLLEDEGVVVTETAAIGLYLADRYALGRLAPAPDDPDRGPYLRWSFFPSAVIEPAAMAHAAKWEYRAGAAGFGTYADMLQSVEAALRPGPYLLGPRFSMADVVMGTTLRYMMGFRMLEPRSVFTDYVARLDARPAWQRAVEINARVKAEQGLG